MRRIGQSLAVLGLCFTLAAVARAADDEATAIIDKAIKAHGVKPTEGKMVAYRGKHKGTLHINGKDLEFTQTVAVQGPDKFKEQMEFSVDGRAVTVSTIFDGKQGWLKANDKEIKVENELLAEFKESAYAMSLSQAMLLKQKGLTYSLLGESKVQGKSVVGVTVSMKGKKDINFYFDKKSGLLVKVERRARDISTGEEVTEERVIKEYQDLKGRKIAKKVEVLRDGKKFIEVEVLESELPDKIEASEFTKP